MEEIYRAMKLFKFLPFSLGVMLFILACGIGNVLTPTPPVDAPIQTTAMSSVMTPRRARTPTRVLPLIPITPPSTPFPVWVADFSNPILASVSNQRPAFEDDFSPICVSEDKKEWKVCSGPEWRKIFGPEMVLATARPTLDLQPDLQNGYTILNKGWFFVDPDSPRNPLYVRIENGELLIELPKGKEKKDLWVYNPKLISKNFVLKLNLQFRETQPGDVVRFQFNQTADESMALDLTKDQTWTIYWGPQDDWQSRSGTFSYFPPEPISVQIILQGLDCAVYLNDNPLVYVNNCRNEPVAYASPSAVKFHLLTDSGHPAVVAIDNVKLWDLDEIPGLANP
jgi:hypothetical protein